MEQLIETTVRCQDCGQDHKLLARPSDVKAWRMGAPIQWALPYLSVDERELLISGTCGECYDRMFPQEEDSLG